MVISQVRAREEAPALHNAAVQDARFSKTRSTSYCVTKNQEVWGTKENWCFVCENRLKAEQTSINTGATTAWREGGKHWRGTGGNGATGKTRFCPTEMTAGVTCREPANLASPPLLIMLPTERVSRKSKQTSIETGETKHGRREDTSKQQRGTGAGKNNFCPTEITRSSVRSANQLCHLTPLTSVHNAARRMCFAHQAQKHHITNRRVRGKNKLGVIGV